MAIPRCKLVERVKPNFAQTFVVEIAWREGTDEKIISNYAFAKMALGECGAVALVNVNYMARYLVLTVSERAIDKYKYKLHKDISTLPGNPEVRSINYMTRRIQRLIGWGDVGVDSAEIEKAAEEGNKKELLAIMPQANDIIKT